MCDDHDGGKSKDTATGTGTDTAASTLDFSLIGIALPALRTLCEHPKTRNLRVLWLGDCNLGDAGMAPLAELLAAPGTTLSHLNLVNNAVGVVGATTLARGLHRNRSLTSLVLTGNQVTAAGMDALAQGLAGHPALSQLLLGNNALGDDGVVALARRCLGPGRACIWRDVDLSGNGVGVVGAAALGAGLSYSPSQPLVLQQLDLSNNELGDAGAAALVAGQQEDRQTFLAVADLVLDANHIGAEGAAVLAEALTFPGATISSLSLTDNKVGDAGAEQLVASSSRLVALYLGNNSISHAGAVAVAITLIRIHPKGLQTLSLEHNQLAAAGVQSLQAVQAFLKLAGTIELHGNSGEEQTLRIGALEIATAPLTILGRGERAVVVAGLLGARTVAIKHVWCTSRPDPELDMEIALLKNADHPNVLKYLHHETAPGFCGSGAGIILLGLEKCDCNLAEAIARNLLPTEALQLSVARQLAQGLQYIHAELACEAVPSSRGLVHGRLCPTHVLLKFVAATGAVRVKISGFGAAAILLDASFTDAMSMQSRADPQWITPEVLAGKPVRSSADIFALGRVLQFMLRTQTLAPATKYTSSHLIARMTAASPTARLSITQVLDHPLFADASARLQRLAAVSDLLEAQLNGCIVNSRELRHPAQVLEDIFMTNGRHDIGRSNQWRVAWHPALVSPNNMRLPGSNVPAGAYNLLRTCRNHWHHYQTASLDELAAAFADTPALADIPAHDTTRRVQTLVALRRQESEYLALAFLPYLEQRVPEIHACVWEFTDRLAGDH